MSDDQTKEARLESLLKAIPGYMSEQSIDRALNEVSSLGVELEADPTQAHLGTKYLQEVLAKCRQHLNRAHIYLQQLRIYEKGLRLKLRERELDLDMKVKAKLADDAVVRLGPSIDDRKALAASFLVAENEDLMGLKVVQLSVETSVRLVKSAYDHLNRTSQDIRLQRQLVRDDRDPLGTGETGGGLTRPSPRQDGTLPNGEAPLATDALPDPKDLLDESKRPDDMPVPINDAHAQMIESFFQSHPAKPVQVKPSPAKPPPAKPEASASDLNVVNVSYEDLLR
jgi:hypothetical protein